MHPYIPDVREVLERKDRPVLGDANLEDLVFTIYSRLWEKWRITTWIPFISFTRSFLKLDGFCLFVLSVWLVGCFSGQWGRGEGFFSAHDPIGRDLHLPVLIFLLALDYTQTSLRLFLCPCTGRFEYKSFLWAFAWLTLCSSSQLFFFFCFLWTSGFKIFHEILNQISSNLHDINIFFHCYQNFPMVHQSCCVSYALKMRTTSQWSGQSVFYPYL